MSYIVRPSVAGKCACLGSVGDVLASDASSSACLYALSGGINVGVCFVRCAVVVLFQFGAYEMLFDIEGAGGSITWVVGGRLLCRSDSKNFTLLPRGKAFLNCQCKRAFDGIDIREHI